ncbi:MAG: hypothetical protein ACOH1N_03145 [Lutibacter sp.]
MKHLKKLSVVLMAILFSVSFTSCIDNEVSPVVEAIYEAQADLLAAQAGVQNAEAALLLAQAQSEQAQAAQTAAITAGITADNTYTAAQRVQYLLQLVADTKLAVDTATKDLALAQVQFDADMAAAVAAMKAAGAQVAVGYAYDYMYAMQTANSLKAQKATEEGNLATLELYLKAGALPTWQTYLADLNADVAVQNGKIAAAQAAIVALNTAKANPTARETQLAGLKSQVAVLTARQTELVALKALATQEVTAAQAAITAATDFMVNPTGPYFTAKIALNTWKTNYTADSLAIKTQGALVTSLTATIANYAGTTTTLTAAKNAAVAVVGQTTTLPYTGLKGDILALQTTLGAYGTAPVYADVPRTGAAALTAYGKLWNADLALKIFDTDFAALTASYNTAAYNLAVAQAAFDGGTWTADLAAANTVLTNANIARTAANTAYGIAKTNFEGDPSGSVITDGPFVSVTDLGNLGIHTSAGPTYMRVATWEDPSTLGNWVPKTFLPTKYTQASLQAALTGITGLYSLDGTLYTNGEVGPNQVGANYAVSNGTEVVLWNQDGTSTDGSAVPGVSVLGAGPVTSLSVAQVRNAISVPTNPDIEIAYFVEVKSDDTNVSKLFTFNKATNLLGLENFSTRNFTSDGLPKSLTNTWTATLVIADAGASYDSTWNGDILVAQTNNTFTAQADVWNAKLDQMKKQYAFDNSSTLLDDAKEAFKYQKELFDIGVSFTRPALKATQTAAVAVIGQNTTLPYTGLLGDIDAKQKQLGSTAFGTPNAGDAVKKTTTGTLGDVYYMVGTVKTLTAYAVKWNAELALKDHLNTPLTGVGSYTEQLVTAQGLLTTATREAAEDLIFIAKYTADLAALQAKYDALILTPLYAALNVTLVNKQQALAVLVAEDAANVTMIATLNLVITGLQGTVPDYTALIAAQNLIITNAKAAILADQLAIATGTVTLANLQRDVQVKKDLIATLTVRIANALAIAAKYKALMDAALVA